MANENSYPGFNHLIAKLDNWVANHNDYSKFGNRGFSILLFGMPGTGKTTLTFAISNHLKSHRLCFCTLQSDNYEGFTEVSCVTCRVKSDIKAPNVIVFDDVDLIAVENREASSNENKDKAPKDKLAMMMKYLDTNYPCVTILTTNYPERLDPALIRTGRINHRMEMGKLPSANVNRIIKEQYPEHPLDYPAPEMLLSKICDVLRHNISDYPGVIKALEI